MPGPLLLLVDDSPDLALIVQLLGKRAGWEVVCRPDVAGAWEWLSEHLPDLVLLDRNLPGPSGLELCRRLRATPRLAHLPVALFVHGGLHGDVAAGLEAGVDFLVLKELVGRPDDWRRRLEEILACSPFRGPGGRAPEMSVGCHPAASPRPPAETGTEVPGSWAVTLNRALDHLSLGVVGPAGLCLLLRRALPQVFAPGISPPDLDAWLVPEAGALNLDRLPLQADPEAVARLAASLADQVGRLLGAEASAPFREILAPLLPGEAENA